ncbi:hypothetical protein PENSPDRAFT_679553 [Peniophora sp. CONT]|nr:hypothetical protein PENSPDRAFT_679553 [Peniophora sp. CONT]
MLGWLMRACYVSFFVCCWASVPVLAQDLSIPSTWLTPTSNLTVGSREALAHGAATALLAQVNPSPGPSTGLPRVPQDITSIYAALSMQDFYSGNSTWSSTVTNGLQTYYNQYGLFGSLPHFNNDATYWALTFFYAYRAYKQQPLLDLAVNAWNVTYESAFITPSAAASGIGAGRNVSFTPSPGCTDTTIAGGMFVSATAQDDTAINVETLGPFMALSAYLYELTSDPIYEQAAQLSLDFIINHLLTGAVVFDTFTLSTCEKAPGLLTLNQAFFVEGLSVFANVTRNDTLTSLLLTVVSNVTTFSTWSSSDGVISEAPGREDPNAVFKGWFVRGLAEARARFPNTDLARYIEVYIAIQHDSLSNNALAPGTDFYTTSWLGPHNSSFSATGNIAALDVLNAAISLPAPTPSPGNPLADPTTPSNNLNMTSTSVRVGVIVGGAVGGLVAVGIFIVAFLLWRRRRRDAIRQAMIDEKPSDFGVVVTVEPFPGRLSHEHPSSKAQRLNAAYQDGSLSTSTFRRADTLVRGSMANRRDVVQGPIDIAELPSLVQRLNNLLLGHEGELPPRYREN